MKQDDEGRTNYGPPGERNPDDLPDPLANWQVLDDETWLMDEAHPLLEGEATAVEPLDDETDAPSSAEGAVTEGAPLIADQHDDIIVAGLEADRLTVEPGQAATFRVGILNNGPKPAVFQLHVEGWLDEAWITVSPVNTSLQPGQRAALDVVIAPGREPSSTAGEHTLAIVTRSPDYPERRSALAATLVIAPFDDLVVGDLQPRRTSVGWNRRATPSRLAITNRGNRPTTVQIRGQDITGACRFEFAPDSRARWQAEDLRLGLTPGETAQLRVRVVPDRPRLVGIQRETLPFRIAVQPADQARAPQMIPGRVENRPMVGPWHLATGLALVMAAVLLALLVGMGGILLLQATRVPAAPVQVAAPAPPVIAVMLNSSPPAAPTSDATAEPVTGPVPGVPVVDAAQVSAPNGEGPLPTTAIQPAPVAPPTGGGLSPAPDAGLTYGEMFQLVARQYDLDWRMLAAQAYIESNFDSLALGADGDLGLMQVLPNTWKAWAPAVGANDPFDAYSNALVAAAYLDHLRAILGERGYGDPRWMLVAYNWGPDKVLAHLEAGQNWEQLAEPRRRYAERILEIAGNIPVQ